jgi:hypothetical protein
MMGLFYGLAIGCLLLSLRHRSQWRMSSSKASRVEDMKSRRDE